MIHIVYSAAGGSWLLGSKQSANLRLNRRGELIAERGANSTERKRKRKKKNGTTPSCGMFQPVSGMMGGGMLLSKPYFFLLPIITDKPGHKLITKKVSPPFGRDQCYCSFGYRQCLSADAVWWNSLESCKVLILFFKPLW